MTDLREAAEELRRIEAMVAQEFANIPTPAGPDKPSERVENVALGLGLYTIAAVFSGWPT